EGEGVPASIPRAELVRGLGRIPLRARVRPAAVRLVAVARLVPALHEVVVHVRRGGSPQLDVDVVRAADRSRRVAGRRHRLACEVDAADESDLARRAGVDEPALLVLAAGAVRLVPARLPARVARAQE